LEEELSFSHYHAKAQRFRLLKLTLILALVGLIAFVDYVTGYQRPMIALYGLPIAIMGWYFGTWQATLLAIVSAFAWGWADLASGHHYDVLSMFALNAVNSLIYFLLVVVCVHYVHRSHELSSRLRRAFSGEIVICTQCERIRSPDLHWTKFEAYVREHADARVMTKVCADCARQSYAVFSAGGANPENPKAG
jgi:hypothetical protein